MTPWKRVMSFSPQINVKYSEPRVASHEQSVERALEAKCFVGWIHFSGAVA